MKDLVVVKKRNEILRTTCGMYFEFYNHSSFFIFSFSFFLFFGLSVSFSLYFYWSHLCYFFIGSWGAELAILDEIDSRIYVDALRDVLNHQLILFYCWISEFFCSRCYYKGNEILSCLFSNILIFTCQKLSG